MGVDNFQASNEKEAYTHTLGPHSYLLICPQNALESHSKISPGSRLVYKTWIKIKTKIKKTLGENYELVGVTSWGWGCGKYPGVYGRLINIPRKILVTVIAGELNHLPYLLSTSVS